MSHEICTDIKTDIIDNRIFYSLSLDMMQLCRSLLAQRILKVFSRLMTSILLLWSVNQDEIFVYTPVLACFSRY